MAKIGRVERYLTKKTGMAAMPKDWQRIEKYHDDAHKDVVDASGHLESHPAPEQYKTFLQSDDTLESHKDPSGGIRRKMIHDIPEGDSKTRFMTKAYHPKLESATRSWVRHPIHGWATLASKAMYDAAGMEDVVENVSAYEHNDVPLTVHTFSPGYKTIHSLKEEVKKHPGSPGSPIKKSIDPLQVRQIAAMDFLMGNNDRHFHNLMVSDGADERGYNRLLAIDHERNFQYFKPLNRIRPRFDLEKYKLDSKDYDLPADYITNTTLHDARRASWQDNHSQFHEWWVENSAKIRESFEQQLEHIRDPAVKDHIKKNFDRRFDMLQKWSTEGVENNYETTDFFSKEYPHVVRVVPKPRASSDTIKSIREKLPANNPEKAIKIIAEAFKKKRSISAQQKLYDVFINMLNDLDHEQLVSMYDKFRNDSDSRIGHQSVAYFLLSNIANRGDKKAAKAMLAYDGNKGRLPVFWKEHYNSMLGNK